MKLDQQCVTVTFVYKYVCIEILYWEGTKGGGQENKIETKTASLSMQALSFCFHTSIILL